MTATSSFTAGMPPDTTHRTLTVGEMLNWYRIEAVLGRGGFGVIYRATDTNLDHTVAIKEYIPSGCAERDGDTTVRPVSAQHADEYRRGLARFIKEARNLVRFKHPNIVRVMSVFQQNNTAYMVMEFEAGVELGRHLNRPGASSEEKLKLLIGPVCEGLLEVHRHGFIHRDVKPANILVRPDGSPVLIDFGSARDASLGHARGMTALVSVGYAPLEQYDQDEHEQQGPWTDLYALGGVLYCAISGNEPIDSARRGSALLNGGRDPLIAASTIGRGRYSARFLAAIDWALEFRIADRPQSVRDWLPALLGHADASARLPPAVVIEAATEELDDLAEEYGEPTQLAPDVRSEEFWPATSGKLPVPGSTSTSTSQPASQLASRRAASSRTGEPRSRAGSSATGAPITAAPVPARSTTRVPGTRRGDRRPGPATRRASRSREPRTSVDRLGTGLRNGRRALLPVLLGVALTSGISWLVSRGGTSPEAPLPAEPDPDATAVLEEQRERLADLERRERAFEERQATARMEAERASATRAARLEAERLDRERAAREAQARRDEQARAQEGRRARALAESSLQFTLALDEAEQALDERRIGAARQALADAAASGFTGRRLADVTERLDVLLAEMRRPVSDTEFDEVVKRFDQLKRAIENKDMATVNELTEPSEQNGLFAQLAEGFVALNMEITGIRVRNADKSVTATLRIRDMLRENGDRAVPSPAFRDREIISRQVGDSWSRIAW